MSEEYITVQEALTAVLANVSVLPAETVPLMDALGRILAQDVIAKDSLPPFSNSSMDGYAVRSADVAIASKDAPVTLRVVAEQVAGQMPRTQFVDLFDLSLAMRQHTPDGVHLFFPVPMQAVIEQILRVTRLFGVG